MDLNEICKNTISDQDNKLELLNLKIDFNFEFKKNEMIEKYLIIGDLLVRLISFFSYKLKLILNLCRIFNRQKMRNMKIMN